MSAPNADGRGMVAAPHRGRDWARWARRGVFAVGDQGLFAASNFVINVMLARRLPAGEYGAFVLAYAVLQLLGQVYMGFVVEPMQVFGARHEPEEFGRYLRVLVRGHWALGAAASVLLAAAGAVIAWVDPGTLAAAFYGLALSAPFIFFSWLLRGACTARVRPELAASAGAINFACVLVFLPALDRWRVLSAPSALIVMAVASIASSTWLLARLQGKGTAPATAETRARVVSSHWGYGRWATGTGVLGWVSTEMFYLVLPIWGGLRETGALKAMANLLLPALQTQYALTNLLTPVLARLRGGPRFRRTLVGAGAGVVAAFAVYWVALGVLRDWLMRLLYDGRFANETGMLWALGCLPLIAGVTAVLTSALRALERPDRVFWAVVAASAVAVCSIALIPTWGARGVVAGRIVSAAVGAVVMGVVAARALRAAPGSATAAAAPLGLVTEEQARYAS